VVRKIETKITVKDKTKASYGYINRFRSLSAAVMTKLVKIYIKQQTLSEKFG